MNFLGETLMLKLINLIMQQKQIAKVNNIGTSGFILKTKYGTNKLDLESKINDADKENT